MKKYLSVLSLIFGLLAFKANSQVFVAQEEDVIIASGNTNAGVYPSTVSISNISTEIAAMAVRVDLFTGPGSPLFWDVILEGPEGQVSILFSDVGNAQGVTNQILLIVDGAPSMPTPTNLMQAFDPAFRLVSGIYSPTDGNFFDLVSMAPDTFAPPAPQGPYSASLAVFKDTNPNGVWKLYATTPFGFMPPAVLNITRWELIIAPYSQNDYVGDGGFHYVAKKGKKVYVVNQTNVVPITKSTPPIATVKAKIVAGADLDGDHISDLIVKKGKTVQGLKGPAFTAPIHSIKVKGMKPVASGDFNGDFIPDLYLQKKTSLYVAINTGTGFQTPQLIADKTLPKKFKVFGALSGRSQPAVLAQNKTTIAQLDGPTFATANQIVQLTSKKIKAGAVGQYLGDFTGATILLQQKKALSFHSPFVPGTLFPFATNAVKGVKLIAPR